MKEIKESKKKNKYKSLTVGVNSYHPTGRYGMSGTHNLRTSKGKWNNHSEVICTSQLLRRELDNSHVYNGSLRDKEKPYIEPSKVGKREYQPCDTPVLSKNPLYDSNSYSSERWQLEWKESLPSRTDIQCIIGCKLIPSDMFRLNKDQSQDAYRRIQGYGEYKPEDILNAEVGKRDYHGKYWLSVVYVGRKDGDINNDIYLRWCNETKLPFPDDLIHTPLKDDRTWSDECLNLNEKKPLTTGIPSLCLITSEIRKGLCGLFHLISGVTQIIYKDLQVSLNLSILNQARLILGRKEDKGG